MLTIKVEHLHLHIDGLPELNTQLAEILTQITSMSTMLQEIKMTDQETLALLGKVDVATTKIGANVDTIATVQQTEANVVQTISDEVDALVAGAPGNGISTQAATILQDVADRLQTSSDKSDAVVVALQSQVPILQAIAAKGAPTVPPVPVVTVPDNGAPGSNGPNGPA